VIVADSGLGKTTFLHWSALEIARDDAEERIPILIEGLTQFAQSTLQMDFLTLVYENLKLPQVWRGAFQFAHAQPGTDLYWDWFQRKFDRGEVVFLLDALDQMSAFRDNLKALVEKLPLCPVILTTRPDQVRDGLSIGTSGPLDWDRVDLDPFTEDDAKKYLGPYAKRFFGLLKQGEP
jgi:predicted NACHT family NTPase